MKHTTRQRVRLKHAGTDARTALLAVDASIAVSASVHAN